MKRTITAVLSFIVLLSSCQSNEQKAESYATKEVKKSLYFPDSFRCTRCTVDTVRMSPALDKTSLELADKLVKYDESIVDARRDVESAERKIRSAKSSVAIWTPAYSAYSRNQLENAREDLKKAEDMLSEAQAKITDLEQKASLTKEAILQRYSEIENIGEPIGWIIDIAYTAQTQGGYIIPSSMQIICDFKYTTTYASLSQTDEDIIKVFDKLAEVYGFDQD